jgi:hypothetical protein
MFSVCCRVSTFCVDIHLCFSRLSTHAEDAKEEEQIGTATGHKGPFRPCDGGDSTLDDAEGHQDATQGHQDVTEGGPDAAEGNQNREVRFRRGVTFKMSWAILVCINSNNMFDLRRICAALVQCGLRMLSFWTPLVVILSKFHLARIMCQSFLRRLVLITMRVRALH